MIGKCDMCIKAKRNDDGEIVGCQRGIELEEEGDWCNWCVAPKTPDETWAERIEKTAAVCRRGY